MLSNPSAYFFCGASSFLHQISLQGRFCNIFVIHEDVCNDCWRMNVGFCASTTKTDSNSAYSGDEESEGEVPSGKKKRAFKHIAACTSDGNQLDNPLSTSSGRYFEFEMKANGLDGYFDESSESEDELGANEDNSFNFEMCRVRRNHRSPNSPPTMSQTGERTKTPDVKRPQLTPAKVAMKNEFVVDVENLDVEDALCVVHEGFAAVPSLAQEDDFDDLDI